MSNFYNSKGAYKTRINSIKTKECRVWENMRYRVEKEYPVKGRETYKNVCCCEKWLDFQNFAEWYKQQQTSPYYREDWHLDKDILSWGLESKVYGPDTYLFLPKDINNLLVNRKSARGDLPLGISRHSSGKYDVRISVKEGPDIRLYTDNLEEGFAFYKLNKEKRVRDIVNNYNAELDPRVYDFFNNRWEITIND